MKLKCTLLLFLITTLLAASCAEHDFPLTFECLSDEEVSFSEEVFPIVQNNCAISGCHNGDNGADKNWLNFSLFKSNAADVKDRITRPVTDSGHMPQTGSISREQIQTIVCWVDQGAQNN
jgi:hypothetical protein